MLDASLTGASNPNTSSPDAQQRDTNIDRIQTTTVANNVVEQIHIEETILRTRVITPPPHIDGHGLIAGLLVPMTMLIPSIPREPRTQVLTTPKTLGVLKGLLIPKPIQPVPVRPEQTNDKQQHVDESAGLNGDVTGNKTAETTQRPDITVHGKKGASNEEPVVHVATPPQDIKHVDGLLSGLLVPVPELVPIREDFHTQTTPEVAGVINGLLIPPTFKPVLVSPNTPTDFPSDRVKTMNETSKRNNSLVESSDFSRIDLNSTQDIFIDDTFRSVNGKIYPVIYEEHAQTFGTRMHAHAVYKYVYPIVIGIALVTMFFLVFVLGVKLKTSTLEMSRASGVLLIAVAIADILTLVFSVTEMTYMFSETRKNSNTMPFDSCRTMLILERLSAIPHVASTWFTVVLSFQRFICVSKPFTAGNYITVKSSVICILCVGVLSVTLHVCRFIDKTFEQIAMIYQNTTINTCKAVYVTWVKDPTSYESAFAWTIICLAQFTPSILIVIFVTCMIISMRKVTMRSLSMQSGDSKMYTERRQLSLFVAAVAFIVFTVEMASGLFLSFNAWEITTGNKIFSYESLRSAAIAFDLILYVSYFIIFLIYCLMSEEIRNNILSLCLKMKVPDKTLHTHSGSGGTASTDGSKQSTSQTFTSSRSETN